MSEEKSLIVALESVEREGKKVLLVTCQCGHVEAVESIGLAPKFGDGGFYITFACPKCEELRAH